MDENKNNDDVTKKKGEANKINNGIEGPGKLIDLIKAKKSSNINIDISVLSNKDFSSILEKTKRFQFHKRFSRDQNPVINERIFPKDINIPNNLQNYPIKTKSGCINTVSINKDNEKVPISSLTINTNNERTPTSIQMIRKMNERLNQNRLFSSYKKMSSEDNYNNLGGAGLRFSYDQTYTEAFENNNNKLNKQDIKNINNSEFSINDHLPRNQNKGNLKKSFKTPTYSNQTSRGIKNFNNIWRKSPSTNISKYSNPSIEYENNKECYYINQCDTVLEYCFMENQNLDSKSSMEDKCKSIENFRGDKGQMLFEVFDGHGGDEVSIYLWENLDIIYKIYLAKTKGNIWKSINGSFKEIDEDIRENIKSSNQGSTGTIVHVIWETNDRLVVYTGNVGDSRVSIISPFSFSQLSKDHRVNEEDEKKRIIEAGGKIINNRINGELMLSRTFGDFGFKSIDKDKKSIVICEPYISRTEIDLNVKNQFLIFASDGIWDTMNEEEIQYIIKMYNYNSNQLCSTIIKRALDKGSWDNISLFVIKLT